MITLIITIAVILLGGYLWYLGGNGFRWMREYLLPVILAVTYSYLHHNWWMMLYAVALIGFIKGFSYGLKSKVHKFWVKIFRTGEDGNFQPVEIVTRATCGFFWSLAGAVFAFDAGQWKHFIIYIPFLVIANVLFGAIIKKNTISELGCGVSVSCSLFI